MFKSGFILAKYLLPERVTNEGVKNIIGNNSYVITKIEQRKCQMFGHISRMQKKILNSAMEGTHIQGGKKMLDQRY